MVYTDDFFLVTFMHLELLTYFCFSHVIARRGLDIAGVPLRKYSTGAGSVLDMVSPLTLSSKANVANAANDTQNEKLQKTLVVRQFSIYHYLKDNHSGQ